MDFCVKCGKKDVYLESLCRECYDTVYKPIVKKKKIKNVKSQLRHSEYYEAILQLRNVDVGVIDFVRERINDSSVFVSKGIF